MVEEYLWVEKYRPKTIDECVLSESLSKTFQEFIDNKEIPNLLLYGTAGTGKTTVARALCEEIDCNYVLINGSEESGIDILRNKIKNFASTVSLMGSGRKIVILDETDYLNPQTTQPALRGFIEEFSSNCGFIFTCNFLNRIISPLHSRCSVIDFTIPKSEKPKIAAEFYDRVIEILETEQIKYETEVLLELIYRHTPDLRRILNELQRYSASGIIDSEIFKDYSTVNIEDLTDLLKQKKFDGIQSWTRENLDSDPTDLFREIYDSLSEMLESESIPEAVVIIADYSYKSSHVSDQEINLNACLVELMRKCEFK